MKGAKCRDRSGGHLKVGKTESRQQCLDRKAVGETLIESNWKWNRYLEGHVKNGWVKSRWKSWDS